MAKYSLTERSPASSSAMLTVPVALLLVAALVGRIPNCSRGSRMPVSVMFVLGYVKRILREVESGQYGELPMTEAVPGTCQVCEALDGIYDEFDGDFDYHFRSPGLVPTERLYVWRNGSHLPIGFVCAWGHVVMDETFPGKGVGSYSSLELVRFGRSATDPRWYKPFFANGPLHLPLPMGPHGKWIVCRATGALVDTQLGDAADTVSPTEGEVG